MIPTRDQYIPTRVHSDHQPSVKNLKDAINEQTNHFYDEDGLRC